MYISLRMKQYWAPTILVMIPSCICPFFQNLWAACWPTGKVRPSLSCQTRGCWDRSRPGPWMWPPTRICGGNTQTTSYAKYKACTLFVLWCAGERWWKSDFSCCSRRRGSLSPRSSPCKWPCTDVRSTSSWQARGHMSRTWGRSYSLCHFSHLIRR